MNSMTMRIGLLLLTSLSTTVFPCGANGESTGNSALETLKETASQQGAALPDPVPPNPLNAYEGTTQNLAAHQAPSFDLVQILLSACSQLTSVASVPRCFGQGIEATGSPVLGTVRKACGELSSHDAARCYEEGVGQAGPVLADYDFTSRVIRSTCRNLSNDWIEDDCFMHATQRAGGPFMMVWTMCAVTTNYGSGPKCFRNALTNSQFASRWK